MVEFFFRKQQDGGDLVSIRGQRAYPLGAPLPNNETSVEGILQDSLNAVRRESPGLGRFAPLFFQSRPQAVTGSETLPI